MSLLRILRNLAILVILTVGSLSLIPRPMAAQSTCRPKGASCTSKAQCCTHYCGLHGNCCFPFPHQACTSGAQCCSGICLSTGCY